MWREVEGWPYEVSDRGEVRRSVNASGTRAGRLLKPRQFANGYLYVCLREHPRLRYVQVHRLVADAFLPPVEGATQINHRDGVKTNNAVLNLERVTGSENMRHAVQTGLHPTGEHHYAARLRAEDVAEIRRLSGQVPQRKLALRYGVSRSAIVHILSGKNWKGVRCEY